MLFPLLHCSGFLKLGSHPDGNAVVQLFILFISETQLSGLKCIKLQTAIALNEVSLLLCNSSRILRQ